MKRGACLPALAASLLAAHLALAQGAGQPQRAPIPPGRVQLLGADMAGSCKAGAIARAHRLADACEGKRQCSFTPELEDAAAETCARDSMALWDCGDGKTRFAALGPQNKGQSREIRLECPPQAVADAPPPAQASKPAPVATAGAVQPPQPGQPDTVTVDEIRQAPIIKVQRPAPTAIDMSAAGVARECDRMNKTLFDGMPGNSPGAAQRLADLQANIHRQPDHSPDSADRSPGRFGAVRGEVAGSPCQ